MSSPHVNLRTGSRIAAGFALPLAVAFAALGGERAGARTDALQAARSPNPVVIENARPGSSSWRLHELPSLIAGYASQVSVMPRETLDLHVSVRKGLRYRIEVYRIGWYGGKGGRLVACSPNCHGGRVGTSFPTGKPDAGTGYLDAGWPVTDRIRVRPGWVSGYYLANLVLPDRRGGSWVPFVVRASSSSPPSTILVQAAENTWQAYNDWGGRSLYFNHTGVGDDHVSFNRPYDLGGNPRNGGWKANLPQAWEFPLIRFLERGGYDVSYTTDADTDRDSAELLRHRLVVSAGHDEYWTTTMRDGFERARNAGVNLAFLGANTGYWQMRYSDDRRTIVEYRTGDRDPEPSPALKTVRFRDLVPPRPECRLLGVEFLEIGDMDYRPVVGSPPDPWFLGTGFTSSSVLANLVGYEYDTVVESCETPPLTRLFHASRPNHPNADAVRYTAPSGATVFSAGSIRFATRLDPLGGRGDPRLQRFMRNALADLTRR